MIATYNGYSYINYQGALTLEGDKNKYIAASIDCMTGNDDKMYQNIVNGFNKAK